jgi:histidinol-phosphate/aromatic aminotransferase/cobyric acid decarboxylase-like protein
MKALLILGTASGAVSGGIFQGAVQQVSRSQGRRVVPMFAGYYGIDPACVVAGNGSDELIAVIMGAFLRPGDKVLTFSPEFSMYQLYGEIYDKENIIVRKKEDLILTAGDVLDAVNECHRKQLSFPTHAVPHPGHEQGGRAAHHH